MIKNIVAGNRMDQHAQLIPVERDPFDEPCQVRARKLKSEHRHRMQRIRRVEPAVVPNPKLILQVLIEADGTITQLGLQCQPMILRDWVESAVTAIPPRSDYSV